MTASISGLTIADGNTSGDGGGVFNGGNLTLSNDTISGNAATEGGGGVIDVLGATATLSGVTFTGNTRPTVAGSKTTAV